MATFASSSLARNASDTQDDGKEEEEEKKPEPKRILTQEVSSMYAFKGELLKAKEKAGKIQQTTDYRSGSKGILHVKKDERVAMKSESAQRKERIKELSKEMEQEEAERLATIKRVMQEKSELYNKLAKGEVVLKHADDTPVDFMVDFLTKKRNNKEELERIKSFEPPPGPSTSSEDAEAVHYIPDEERRVYGASHVRFSQNEEKRRKQMDDLVKMSDETASAREKIKMMKEKRDELKRQKVNKLRLRMGLAPLKDPTPPPEVNLDEIPIPADPKEEISEQFEKRIKSNREWDRGKDRYHQWIEKEREERNEEFAPPKFY